LIDCLDGQMEQWKAGGRSGIRGGAAVQRKEGGEGMEGETDRWVPTVSGFKEKEKGRGKMG
jgi:hypothetical protein